MTNLFAIKQIIDERNAALDMVRTVETLNAELEEKIEALQLVVNNLTKHDGPDRLDNLKASNAIEMTKEISVLQAEIAALKADLQDYMDAAQAEAKEVDRLNGEIAALRKNAGRLDWLANNPVEALDIFGHARPGEARDVRTDIDAAIAQAAQPENEGMK